jgi:hypothetical protein
MATVSIHVLQARAWRTLRSACLWLCFFASPADAIVINIQATVTWLVVPDGWTPPSGDARGRIDVLDRQLEELAARVRGLETGTPHEP